MAGSCSVQQREVSDTLSKLFITGSGAYHQSRRATVSLAVLDGRILQSMEAETCSRRSSGSRARGAPCRSQRGGESGVSRAPRKSERNSSRRRQRQGSVQTEPPVPRRSNPQTNLEEAHLLQQRQVRHALPCSWARGVRSAQGRSGERRCPIFRRLLPRPDPSRWSRAA